MRDPDFDVAIVGASIAGSTAATLLGRSGARVALIDGHANPTAFKRMCTHYIQSSASPVLERLGLTDAIERAGARPSGLNLWTRYGWISFTREKGEPPAWNFRRERLDPLLRKVAADTPGVELMLGRTATGLRREGDRVAGVVIRSLDGEEDELSARLVVAADGRQSTVAKLVNVPTKIKRNERFGYFAYYRDTPLVTGDSAQMWLLDPDTAYAFPTDDRLTLLACMPTKEKVGAFKADPEAALERLFATLPNGPALDPSKRVGKVFGKLDVPNEVRPATAAGVAFIGDAAIAADPLWGVGCGWALQSAEWLADAVAPALAGDGELDPALKAYRRRHRAALGGHEKMCSEYSSGRRFNAIEKLLYRAAARDEVTARRMARFGERWITPRELLTPRTLGRIVRVNLSRRRQPTSAPAAPAAPVVG
jgi:menaquinone-9 beta-reductase